VQVIVYLFPVIVKYMNMQPLHYHCKENVLKIQMKLYYKIA